MSLRSMKRLARTSLGGVQLHNECIGDVHRVSAVSCCHCAETRELVDMGVPLMRADEGSEVIPMHSRLTGVSSDGRKINVCYGDGLRVLDALDSLNCQVEITSVPGASDDGMG